MQLGLVILLFCCGLLLIPESRVTPIQFAHTAIAFSVENSETPERHAPETMAGATAIFDYDNDGDLDIFFANGADIRTLRKSDPKYHNRLFANDGKGHFRDVTDAAGLNGSGFSNGIAIGDYDNDGYKDIFVGGVHANALYHNNRDGTFSDVTHKVGLDRPDPIYGPLWSVGGAWLDVNNDGLLDLFVTNYLSWDLHTEPRCPYQGHNEYCHPRFYKPTPSQLFLNRGNGTFLDISAESGIRSHPGKGMSTGVADYDLDGRMDIFVANDKAYNLLFHSTGPAKFEEVAFEANVALRDNGELISGMGAEFRDLDEDGYPDLLVVALDDETFPFFRNVGKGEFADWTRQSNLASLSLPMAGYSPNVADFDNDGRKDVFVSRGHVQSPLAAPRIQVEQHNTVFRNLGARFVALTAEAGLTAQPPRRHRGAAVGDLDGDGRMDVVVTALLAPAEVWMNESSGTGHWVAISLEGTRSNRDGIGARIRVITQRGTQYNELTTTCGYASSSAGPVHFGLGSSKTVDTIEIHWPSGTIQRLHAVAADRVVRVREPM